MLKKLRAKLRKKQRATPVTNKVLTDKDVKKLVEQAYIVGYNDGRRDGLAIARKQATNSLKEILWQQNKTQ